MKWGRIFSIGILTLAVGCSKPQFERKEYLAEDLEDRKVYTIGALYTVRDPAGYTEYIDYGPGGEIFGGKENGTLDEKKIYKYRKNEPAWLPFRAVGLAPVEITKLVEDEETMRDLDTHRTRLDLSAAPFEEGTLEHNYYQDTANYVTRSSAEGWNLQHEFEEVKRKTP